MTLQELYESIDGDYEQAKRVLRMDKLIDKHIRKLTTNGVVSNLLAAGDAMDPTELFERAHAAKGVCGNLGLVKMADYASDIAEEYRPGNTRTLTDDEVKGKLQELAALYEKTEAAIAQYAEG
jgi:HPt (histidine-containing phosphotransfer) domain-containing protein